MRIFKRILCKNRELRRKSKFSFEEGKRKRKYRLFFVQIPLMNKIQCLQTRKL